MKKMYRNNTLIIFFCLIFVLSSCFESEVLPGGGEVADPSLEVKVLDSEGSGVANATVEVYSDYSSFITGQSALGTTTSDANGIAVFSGEILGEEAGNFYFNIFTDGFAAVNWNGTINTPVMLLNAGQTRVTATLGAPAYSAAISGSTEVISGTSGVTYGIAPYPGTYSWSSDSENVVFNSPNQPRTTVNFKQNATADETITLTLDYSVGTESGTMTFEVLSTQFCPIPKADLVGTYEGQDGNLDGIAWVGAAAAEVTMGGNGELQIEGLNVDFMENIWAEIVQEQVAVTMIVDETTLAVTIPDQYIFTTLYDGALYDYHISGTGLVDGCTGTITLDYEMTEIGGGFAVGAWLNANGYMSDPVFKAVLQQ